MRASVQTAAAAGLRSVDAYNYFPCLNNLVFAYLAAANTEDDPVEPLEPQPDKELIWLPEAGLARVRRGRYDVYVGVAKGGVVKVFDRACRRHVYTDCGYLGRLQNGKLFSNQIHRPGRSCEVAAQAIQVEGKFCDVAKPTMNPVRFLAFRGFSLTVGRVPLLARWLKQRLVKALIYNQKELNIRFKRHIDLKDDRIVIRDEIGGPDASRVRSIARGEVFTTIHMGSARYFVPAELERSPAIEPACDSEISPGQLIAGVTLTRTVRLH